MSFNSNDRWVHTPQICVVQNGTLDGIKLFYHRVGVIMADKYAYSIKGKDTMEKKLIEVHIFPYTKWVAKTKENFLNLLEVMTRNI